MTEDATPTDADSGVEETLPEQNTAVDESQDTASQATEETGSQDNQSQGADSDLKRFAKSQGFDPDHLSEGEVKALKIAHKQVRETRKQLELKHRDAVEKEVSSVKNDESLSDREYFEFRMKQRDMIDNIRDYWRNNPDDKKYEAEAIALLNEEKERYGTDAMLRLADNMPRLIREAKYNAGATSPEAAAEQGRKEERERLNKLQQGAADNMSASTNETQTSSVVNDEWLENVYDPDNPEHVKMLNACTSGGNIY
jgi:hypothetical protein|nr:MAG TPA: hypothetical protein [Caudoviricetes sp.]